jgi:hypothetical protein
VTIVKVRNPKAEGRKKSEARNPKLATNRSFSDFGGPSGFGFRALPRTPNTVKDSN